MVKFNDKEYSGQVLKTDDDKITAIVYTVDSFKDVSDVVYDTTVVTDYSNNDTQVYNVTFASSGKIVANNTYYFEFSLKQPKIKQLEDTIREQNAVIDELLVAILEG